MIHAHSLGRAARYFPERPAVFSGATRLTFGELHGRVVRVAATLSRHGFAAGDRLALLLPNEAEYLELVYACAWLGVIAVPLNTRFSAVEIDRVLADAGPYGLIRHSALPAPTAQVPWQRVLDKEPLELQSDSYPEAIYDPDAVLALIYTSGTTGHPKGVMLTHAATLANVDHLNYWMPYHEGGVYLHAAPLFHIADFPFMFAAPALGACQVTIPKFSPEAFCETVQRERVSYTVLVPTMINLLTQFPELTRYDLGSLKQNDSVMQLQQAPVSRRSPNCGIKNSKQKVQGDYSFSCNSSFKMESTNVLHGFIGVIGAVRLTRQLLATDQAPRANRRERTPN